MKTILPKNSTAKEIFVVLGSNLEYNDSTYNEYGQILTKSKYYSSKKEAEDDYVKILKHSYGWLRLYEIEEYTWGSANESPLYSAYEAINGSMYNSQLSFLHYIEWLEQFKDAENVDIKSALPNFLEIYKLEFEK